MRAIDELRSIAHIIDMHQLTKNPERVFRSENGNTATSPKMNFTEFELRRYLNYCSEMLSLVGKLAAIYVQKFDDSVALASASEVESLTTGLSRKIWQKLSILQTYCEPDELANNGADSEKKDSGRLVEQRLGDAVNEQNQES